MLGVIALALLLDSEGSSSPNRAPAGARPASLSAAEVARIARRVERIRQLHFKRPVKPLFVGRDVAVRLAEAGSAEQYPESRRRADEESLKLLGLMKPGESLAAALAAVSREQILGFYDDRSKRLVVVRDSHANRPLLEITLAHELTHALEDQRFGLGKGGSPSDDGATAASALAEGSATEVMIEYGARYFTTADALGVLAATGDTETKLPTYVEDTLLFPYEQGLRFVQSFRGESGSWGALDNVWRFQRPATEEQVMHLDKYAVGERPVPVRLPDLGLVLGSGWQRLGESSVGELDLREIFKIDGEKEDDSAAAGWGGGRFELWRHGPADAACTAPCVSRDVGVMGLAWDTPADRRAGERALSEALTHGLEGRRLAGRLWSSRGGAIAVSGAGKRTAIVLAPDAKTASGLLRQAL